MMTARSIFMIFLTFSLFNCSENVGDIQTSNANKTDMQSQSTINISPVVIGPEYATRQEVITLKADDSILNGGKTSWYINGSLEDSEKLVRFSSNNLNKGDVLQAVIVNNKKEFVSNEITIGNTPPTILDAELLPRVPLTSSTLQVIIKSSDVDNDNISYKYEWSLNEKFAGEESYLASDLKRGDKVVVVITPYDGEDYGRPIRIKSRIQNSYPVFSYNSPYFEGTTYKYNVTASDPDGDTLLFTLKQGPPGMTIDSSSGLITWKVKPEDEGVHDIKVSISDNNGGEVTAPFNTRIAFAQN